MTIEADSSLFRLSYLHAAGLGAQSFSTLPVVLLSATYAGLLGPMLTPCDQGF